MVLTYLDEILGASILKTQSSELVLFLCSCSRQDQRRSLCRLCRRRRPEEGSNQADEVPHEASDAAVGQGERLHQRYLCSQTIYTHKEKIKPRRERQ